ncbi:MAG TPA: hypothetical protein PKW55_08205, partial [Spirochaetota bacterium]|nr:hypothetical protein [Spirochaetota bacterium]
PASTSFGNNVSKIVTRIRIVKKEGNIFMNKFQAIFKAEKVFFLSKIRENKSNINVIIKRSFIN